MSANGPECNLPATIGESVASGGKP
ncbi:MAG: hypothetical protein JWR00_1497, partial [Rubritepida sp.]|nr:hypothetical protein [Rubritepida sp.]